LVPAHHRQRVVQIGEGRTLAGEYALAEGDHLRRVAEREQVLVVELAQRELWLPDDWRTGIVADVAGRAPVAPGPAPATAIVDELYPIFHHHVRSLADHLHTLERAGAGLAGGELEDADGAAAKEERGEAAAVARLPGIAEGSHGAHQPVHDRGR